MTNERTQGVLELQLESRELYDDSSEEFISIPGVVLRLEHSLLSLSKWESKYHRSFLSSTDKKTDEETNYYIQCMTLNRNIDPMVYRLLTVEDYQRITDYIQDSMTATTFHGSSSGSSRQIVTSELIYHWMIEMGVPFECEKWHLNRLLTLIRVRNVKLSAGNKKMSKNELLNRNRALNAQRKASHIRGT